MKIKILQWNIWVKERIENIISELKRFDADILCLQELTQNYYRIPENGDTPKRIADELGFNYHYAVAQERTGERQRIQGNGIFTRFPIVKKYKAPLIPFCKDTEGYRYWQEGRVYVETEIDAGAERPLTVGTTHLSYSPHLEVTEHRIPEFKRLTQEISYQDGQYIFSGDLNVAPNTPEVKRILSILENAGPPLDLPTWTTKRSDHHGWVVDSLSWRLDYIFKTADINVVSSEIPDTSASDHLPVIITIDI